MAAFPPLPQFLSRAAVGNTSLKTYHPALVFFTRLVIAFQWCKNNPRQIVTRTRGIASNTPHHPEPGKASLPSKVYRDHTPPQISNINDFASPSTNRSRGRESVYLCQCTRPLGSLGKFLTLQIRLGHHAWLGKVLTTPCIIYWASTSSFDVSTSREGMESHSVCRIETPTFFSFVNLSFSLAWVQCVLISKRLRDGTMSQSSAQMNQETW
jgi:hypothetical protein